MNDGKVTYLSLTYKTVVVHTVTYVVVGLLAFTLLDYRRLLAEPSLRTLLRRTDDPWVMAGPLFQPLRGLLFALAFYPLREVLFGQRYGWLVLWLELVVLGILSTFGPVPGSVEGLVYTVWPLWAQMIGLPEVLVQSLALSAVLYYWVNHPDKRWLSWALGVVFLVALLLPVVGLLSGRGAR
jgi:hypothetical protein